MLRACCWCLVLLAMGAQAAFFSGSVSSVETWKYVARFAFLPTDTSDAKEIGTFHHKVRFLTNSTTSLAVYYSGYKNFMGDAVNGVASCAAPARVGLRFLLAHLAVVFAEVQLVAHPLPLAEHLARASRNNFRRFQRFGFL